MTAASTGGWPEADGNQAVHEDVHSVLTHPASPDLVLAATGGGLYRSTDGGLTWLLLYRCYCRAAWWDDANPNHILFGPAAGVGRGGRIEFTNDGGVIPRPPSSLGTGSGQAWEDAGAGLETPWPRTMVERFTPAGDQLLAVLDDGRLFASALADTAGDWRWRRLLPEIDDVQVVTTMAAT